MSFEATSGRDDGGLVLTLKGCADSLVLQALASAVGAVHLEASQAKARRVVVDLRALDFMNSSCFKTFVSWLSELRETAPEERYVVEFVSDPGRHWQRRSLAALVAFGGDLVKVRLVEGAAVA